MITLEKAKAAERDFEALLLKTGNAELINAWSDLKQATMAKLDKIIELIEAKSGKQLTHD